MPTAPIQSRSGLIAKNETADPAERNKVESVDFFEYFRKQNDWMFNEQKTLWQPIYENAIKSAAYAMGRQALIKNPAGYGYKVYKFRGTEQDLHVYNAFSPYVDEITSQWVNLNPKIEFALLTEDEQLAKEAKDEYEALRDHLDSELLQQDSKLRIALNGQLGGQYIGEIFFDPTGDAEEQYTPMEAVEVPEMLTATCLDCGHEFEPNPNDPQPICASPYCNSPNVEMNSLPGTSLEIPGEPQRRKAGKIRLRIHDMWNCRYNLTVGKDQSDYFYIEEEALISQVEARYGRLNGSAKDAHFVDDEIMHSSRIMRRLERTHQPTMYSSGTGTDDHSSVIVQRFFYSPERLQYIKLKEAVTLTDEWGNDWEIPANQPLAEVCPQGLTIKTALGADRFFCVEQADHRRRFKLGKYSWILGKEHGRGVEDARVGQFQRNKLRSPMFQHWVRALQPSIVVDKRVFGNDTQLFNRPNGIIEANTAMLDGRAIDTTFAAVQAPTIDQAALLFDSLLDADMQRNTKAYTSQSDTPGSNNDTATAVKAGLAQRQQAPSLHYALYAGWLKEIYVECFELVKEHHKDLLIIAKSDKLNSERKAAYFDTNLLREGSLVAWVRPRSFLPDLEMEKRAKFIEATTAAQGLAAIGMLNEKTMAQLNELFSTDIEATNDVANEVCEDQFDIMQQLEQQQQGMILPDELYLAAQVDPYELGHEEAIMWWRKLLTSTRGRKLSPTMREAIHMQIDARKEAATLVMTEQAMMQAAPGMQLQAMMPPPEEPTNNKKESKDYGKGNETKSSGASEGNPAAAAQSPDLAATNAGI